jgi:6-phosphofructokinase 1
VKRIGVLTSGGDAPGMNAAVRAVVRYAINNDMSVIGVKRGYNGLLMESQESQDDFTMMTSRSVSDKIHRGGTFLMTARCLAFLERPVQERAIRNLQMIGVEGLVCVGGDGTFHGAKALNDLGLPTIGVPGTIDNDLAYTDYTIGFDTAVNTACEMINRIRETSDSHERASLVSVMGRACGDIAVSTALACGAEVIMVPEIDWKIEEVARRVRDGVLSGKRSMILVFAEGALQSQQSDMAAICAEYEDLKDVEIRHMDGTHVARILEELSGHETRATVLGYTQRGGSPSANDRILASRLGVRAVELLKADKGGMAVGIRENKIIEVPLDEAIARPEPVDNDLIRLIQALS